MQRRQLLKNLTAGALAATGLPKLHAAGHEGFQQASLKGRINHSVCRWCFDFLTLDQLCVEVKKIGFTAIDLVGPKDWPVLKQHGIDSSMCNGAEIALGRGWNDKQYHATRIKNYTEHIELV